MNEKPFLIFMILIFIYLITFNLLLPKDYINSNDSITFLTFIDFIITSILIVKIYKVMASDFKDIN